MKTSPFWRPDGTIHAFEFPHFSITLGRLKDVLSEVPGVSNIRDNDLSDENRLEFEFQEIPCVVWEPFGDNSHYWVGPKDPESSTIDMSDVHAAILNHQPFMRVGIPGIIAIALVMLAVYSGWERLLRCFQ